ncbi:MAG: hypothetical protein ABI481_02965 [Pyrinomonadaceae bacterium]
MKRIILAISVLLVLGLAVAAIAYNRNTVTQTVAAASCCSHGADSCPMKKDAAGKETASCCDEDCCKGDSCPMKTAAGGSSHHADSCPMNDKDGQASHATMTEAQHEAMKADGKSCCCSCCGAKQDA